MSSITNEPEQGGSIAPAADSTHKKPTVCVFCGASPGVSPAHLAAARSLAQAFHKHDINLVYGGGDAGIMGEVARTLVSLSGPEAVHGVIPSALIVHERQTNGLGGTTSSSSADPSRPPIDADVYGRTTVVKDMHTRKQLMAREVIESGPGGGFVALSGGYGTLEELMEMVTWNQLGIHARGVVVFNIEGYYDGLLSWVKNAVSSGFVSKANANIMVEARTADEVVERLRDYREAEGRFKLQWEEK